MDSTADSSKVTRFRPTSWEDFKTYAANLAWVIEVPTQQAQEVLARIYGYASTHDLHQNLKRPGTLGTAEPEAFFPFGMTAEATARILRVIRDLRHLAPDAPLPSRDWAATEIGLFERPSVHKRLFKRIALTVKVQTHTEPIDAELTAGHYATVVMSHGHDGKPETQLHLTDLGRAVFDAGKSLLPDRDDCPPEERLDPIESLNRLEELIRRHPNNPWLPAMLVSSIGPFYFQGGWADNLPRGTLDADPGYLEHARKNAPLYLDYASRSIALFDALLGDRQAAALPDHRYASSSDGEPYYYPAVHYFGAFAAANAGDEKLATRWLRKYLKLVPSDSFDARHLLSALLLNEGRPVSSIEALCKIEHRDGWMWTCVAAAAANGNLKSKFTAAITELLLDSWAPVEVYAGRWTKLRQAFSRTGSNHKTPAFFQELEYRTRRFWSSAPRVRTLFERMCTDKTIRQATFDHHAAEAQRWGLALRPAEEQASIYQLMDQAKTNLTSTLADRLPDIWDETMGS